MKIQSFFCICFSIFIFQISGFGQKIGTLKFTDGSELAVTTGFFDEKVDSVSIVEKNIIAVFTGNQIGESGKFNENIVKIIKRRDKILSNKLKSMDTAYTLEQGESDFDIPGFNSIDFEKIRNCQKCRLECRIIIIEVKSNNNKFYIPVIRRIKIVGSK